MVFIEHNLHVWTYLDCEGEVGIEEKGWGWGGGGLGDGENHGVYTYRLSLCVKYIDHMCKLNFLSACASRI